MSNPNRTKKEIIKTALKNILLFVLLSIFFEPMLAIITLTLNHALKKIINRISPKRSKLWESLGAITIFIVIATIFVYLITLTPSCKDGGEIILAEIKDSSKDISIQVGDIQKTQEGQNYKICKASFKTKKYIQTIDYKVSNKNSQIIVEIV